MEGRIETELKIEQCLMELLSSSPSYVRSWYQSMRASGTTIKSCRDYVHKVVSFLQSENISDLSEITEDVLTNYFIKLQTKTDSNGKTLRTSLDYRHSVWYALNNFFTYQLKVGKISTNYMSLVKPKRKKKLEDENNKLRLTWTDFQRMLDNTPGESTQFKVRNHAILLLYMTTGMRRDALCQINMDDVDLPRGKLSIIDKGEKKHTYDLSPLTISALEQWIAVRANMQISPDVKALFVSSRLSRITGNAVYEMVKKSARDGLGRELSPHKLRGGYCSILYEQTHDIEFVCNSVGHSDPSITHRYVTTKHDERKIAANIFANLLH